MLRSVTFKCCDRLPGAYKSLSTMLGCVVLCCVDMLRSFGEALRPSTIKSIHLFHRPQIDSPAKPIRKTGKEKVKKERILQNRLNKILNWILRILRSAIFSQVYCSYIYFFCSFLLLMQLIYRVNCLYVSLTITKVHAILVTSTFYFGCLLLHLFSLFN